MYYSGVNMYAMLTGKLPFNSSSITELHRLATEGNYIKPQVSDDCLDLLAGLLTGMHGIIQFIFKNFSA